MAETQTTLTEEARQQQEQALSGMPEKPSAEIVPEQSSSEEQPGGSAQLPDDAVIINDENGQFVHVGAESGQIYDAIPDHWSHPSLRADSSPDTVRAIANLRLSQLENEQRTAALKNKEEAKKAAASTSKRRKQSPQQSVESQERGVSPVEQAAPSAAESIVDEFVQQAPRKKRGGHTVFSFEMDELAAPPEQQVPPQQVAPPQQAQGQGQQQTQGQVNNTSRQQPKSQQGGRAPASGYQATPSTIVDEELQKAQLRKEVDEQWDKKTYAMMKQAQRHNKEVNEKKAKITDPGALSKFNSNPANRLNPEAFDEWTSIIAEVYQKNPIKESPASEKEIKDQERLWKQIEQLMRDIRIGFFHIEGEILERDKQGKATVRYGRRATAAIGRVCREFGLSSDFSGMRTVFRMVRVYCSMSIDRHGHMFGQKKDEWSMKEDDFIRVCDLMIKSAREDSVHHNPFRIVDRKAKLGGTRLYPAGIIPKVILKAICNSKSICGTNVADLANACLDEWNNTTYPTLLSDTADEENVERQAKLKQRNKARRARKHDLFKPWKEWEERKEPDNEGKTYAGARAQLVVIEGVMQGLARIDGMTADDFSKFNIDTEARYTIEEYKDATALYAAALHDNYDAGVVAKREIAKADQWKKQLQSRRFVKLKYTEDNSNSIQVGKEADIVTGLRMGAGLIRGNALALNIPIAIATAAEHIASAVTTDLSLEVQLAIYNKDAKKYGWSEYKCSPAMKEALVSEEMKQAMDAAKLLFDTYGPGAVRNFVREGHSFTYEEVEEYIRKRLKPGTSHERWSEIETVLADFRNKFLAGDFVCKGTDILNWYKGLMLNHAARSRVQERLRDQGRVDKMGIALTVEELEDTYRAASSPEKWLASMMADDLGISAYIQMRGNSIAGLNPFSFNVQSFQLKHGVADALITIFVDNFPKYGLNLLYNFIPFSKTITYCMIKRPGNENAATETDLVIGGNLGGGYKGFGEMLQDPGFRQGFELNLIYDSFTFARFWLVTPFILSHIFMAAGWEPPDDPLSLSDPSAWKIGGVEVQKAFWINDLTLFGLPFAYYFATGITTQDWDLAGKLMTNSLYEQLDGNVLFDIMNIFKSWQNDLVELAKMAEDPEYDSDKLNMSSVSLAMYEYFLNVVNKVTPGAPLFRNITNSALIFGDDAPKPSPYKEWDLSDEWHIENGITKYVDDPRTVLEKKAAMQNPAIALGLSITRNILGMNPGTSYWIWGMPPSSLSDPLGLGYLSEEAPKNYTNGMFLDFDYDNRGIFTEAEYDYLKTQEFFSYIDGKGWTGPNDAAADGFFLPNDFKWAIKDVLYSEMNALENDLQARVDAGEIVEGSDEWWNATKKINTRKRDIKGFVSDWIDSDTLASWYPSYEQVLTSGSTRYYYKDTYMPATWVDWLLNPDDVVAEWRPKGNHPNNLAPWTTVDTEGKGYNAETIPSWYKEGFTDLEGIKNGVGNQEIKFGRFEGQTVNDVIFGGVKPDYAPFSNPDEYSHPDEPTIGIRSYVAKKTINDEALRNLKQETASGSVYGTQGRGKDAPKETAETSSAGASRKATVNTDQAGSVLDTLGVLFGVKKAYADEPVDDAQAAGQAALNELYGSNLVAQPAETAPDSVPSSTEEPLDEAQAAGKELLKQKTYFPIETYGYFTDSGGSEFYDDLYGDGSGQSSIGNWTWLGPAYGSRSTSASSYMPKVYSNPRSLSSNRAATMYSKQPRDASYSYLRPSFETRGSRSAYER